MTQEEKLLLIKDICGRLPYGVKIQTWYGEIITSDLNTFPYGIDETPDEQLAGCKPYLRPMSSMTEEEEGMYNLLQGISHLAEQHWTAKDGKVYRYADAIDWLNEHHFDYRGLIEKGLALEAPEGMYD